ncbi:hypothetical protein HPB50_011821 [Hyalomma asiaticum]|uniref:Uncharacterized protein n=1 Tax=Hyalomma asiaticum TaxID=266040 RepID=A0ACB7RT92_HYAAI|nr:hypothetical protein HPB50_011821 [Hyalomma asiaticum]
MHKLPLSQGPCCDDPNPMAPIPAGRPEVEAKAARSEARRLQKRQKSKSTTPRPKTPAAACASSANPANPANAATQKSTAKASKSLLESTTTSTPMPLVTPATNATMAAKSRIQERQGEAGGLVIPELKEALPFDNRDPQARYKSPLSESANAIQQGEKDSQRDSNKAPPDTGLGQCNGHLAPSSHFDNAEKSERPASSKAENALLVDARAPNDRKTPSRPCVKANTLKTTSTKKQQKKEEAMAGLNALLPVASIEAPSASTVAPLTPPWRHWRACVHVKVLSAGLLLGVAAILFISLTASKRISAVAFCITEGCEKHRQLLENQLDKSTNPCSDFGAYVCRKWMPRKEFAELSRSMMSDMILGWLSKLPDTLAKSAAQLPVGAKAGAMFNSCVGDGGSGVPVIKEFMHARGLAWPEDPDGSVQPLEALFDLSFNWRVHLWFRLNMLPLTRQYGRRLITVSHNDLLALWWQVFRQIPKERFDSVYNAFFDLFANDTTNRPRRERIEEIQRGLNIVFETFLPSGKWIPRMPSLLSLRDLDEQAPMPIGEKIMSSLNSVLGIHPPVTLDDLVLLGDDDILEDTFALLGNYSDRDVLHHLSWMFMQACAVVADPATVLVILHGNERHAVEHLPRFCARQVEDSYKLMVASMASVAHFTKDERQRISDFLVGIEQEAIEKTLAASWLDNATSHLLAEKLADVESALWPEEKFLTEKGLGDAYAHFPDAATSFASFWIETRRSQRGLFGSEAGEEEQRIPDSMAQPYVQYLHGLNKLSLSIGALAPPLYYTDGTSAMLYGGPGYFYAKGLLEAIDSDGIRVDSAGHIGSSWLGKAAETAFAEHTFGCLPQNASVFPQIPAIEVAYAAFKRHLNEKNMQISKELTEEKVFFITACLLSCAKAPQNGPFGSDCNKAVMNFAPFAEAFSCPPGSKMNPAKKCAFF